MNDNVIYSEVSFPSNEEFLLSRPHIDSMLKNAIQKPLTAVIAGAGYGKTQAVSSILKTITGNIIWIQLSALDNFVTNLWENLISSVEPHSKNLAGSLEAAGYPDSMLSFDQFLHLIAEELMDKERYVIVLDDFHLIHDKTILNFFERLISSRINKLSIIIISRTQPNLNLTIMFAKGILTRITEDDLRFSKAEMAEYYCKQGAKLSENMLHDIYSYTDGWIVAIYLVWLSIKKNKGYEQNPISSAKIDIFDLIENEIFKAASKELQNLLIKLSFLDDLPIGLLKELSHDNNLVLSEMIKISLFIRYNSFSDSYRIHHLFKEFLSEKKNLLTHEDIMGIHIIAAKWHHKNNNKLEAINHYKECQHYNEIFDIILLYSQRVPKEIAELMIELIEQAPDEVVQARPIMEVVKANYLFNNNKIDTAYKELLRIRKKYEALPPTKDNLSILGEAFITLALISIVNKNFEFEDLFIKAADCLPDGSTLVDFTLNIAEGINFCGIKNPIPGELEKYNDALFHAMPFASRVMNGCGYGMEYLNACDSAYMIGDIKNAEINAYEAIYRSRLRQQHDIEFMADFILVRINIFKGDYSKVVSILEEMKRKADKLQIWDLSSIYDIIEGWFYTSMGETGKVSKWIMHENETRKALAPVVLGREHLVRSNCYLFDGRYQELLSFIEQLDILYQSRGLLYGLIQNRILKSIVYHYIGNHEESMRALVASYQLSYGNNLTIQYIEYGDKMQSVIAAVQQDANCKIPKPWLENIYLNSSAYAKQLSQAISGHKIAALLEDSSRLDLTKRELEVLSSFCHGSTREQIAESYHLSVNTVRNMLQNIYTKLGATNSIDAVRIATMLNLDK